MPLVVVNLYYCLLFVDSVQLFLLPGKPGVPLFKATVAGFRGKVDEN